MQILTKIKQKNPRLKDKISQTTYVSLIGDVDHGKTTLFEKLSKKSFLKREYRAITQNIYTEFLPFENQNIILFDSPGHENFEHMRRLVSELSNVVLYVISPMEANTVSVQKRIEFFRNSNKMFLVLLTKLDLYSDEAQLIRKLEEMNILPHSLGGSTEVYQLDYTEFGMKAHEFSFLNKINIDALKGLIFEFNELSGQNIEPDSDDTYAYVLDSVYKQNFGSFNICVALNDFNLKNCYIDKVKYTLSSISPRHFWLKGEFSTGTILCLSEQQNNGFCIMPSYSESGVCDNNELGVVLLSCNENKLIAMKDLIHSTFRENVQIIKTFVGDIDMLTLNSFLSNPEIIILGFDAVMNKKKIELLKNNFFNVKSIYDVRDIIQSRLDIVLYEKRLYDIKNNNLGLGSVIATFKMHVGTIFGCKWSKGELKINDRLTIIRKNKIIYELLEILSLRVKLEDVKQVEAGMQVGILFKDKSVVLQNNDTVIVHERKTEKK